VTEQSDDCVPCANLRKRDLSRLDLSGRNLEFADLEDANLSRANLRNAILFWANLPGANLDSADLRGTDLRYANLLKAKLKDISVDEKTDFTGALLDDHIFVSRGSANGPRRLVGARSVLARYLRMVPRLVRFKIRFRLRRLRK
jgi:uncharacterized protein YjbI with pentapeptide repeats